MGWTPGLTCDRRGAIQMITLLVRSILIVFLVGNRHFPFLLEDVEISGASKFLIKPQVMINSIIEGGCE